MSQPVTQSSEPPDATATIAITAPVEVVYALLTDLDTLAELAEETHAMRWTHGVGAVVGARFRGANRNGVRRWSTTCTVVEAEPGRAFAFDVHALAGRVPIARWRYQIDVVDGGCRVRESTWDERPGWFAPIGTLSTGVSDRPSGNLRNIETTLRRLKERAEAGEPIRP